MPSPDPARLLDVARQLAGVGTPEASRRAISTVYYALFHCLVRQAADWLVGEGDTSPTYAMFYRSLDHTKIRSVLAELGKSHFRSSFRKALRRDTSSPALREFASAYTVFLEAREVADYHPFMPVPSRHEVEDMISEAESVLQDFAALDENERTEMLALMIAGARA